MACTMTEASYQRGCRCSDCTSAHRSYSQSRRYRGLPSANKVGRPLGKKKTGTNTGRGAMWHDALTRKDIMAARDYHQELIDMNRERINEERDNEC